MRTVKSNAKRQNLGLTVPVATRQARRIVDAVMPGVMATVESRNSFDTNNDMPIIVTTVTFPANLPAAEQFAIQANLLTARVGMTVADSSIVITRKV